MHKLRLWSGYNSQKDPINADQMTSFRMSEGSILQSSENQNKHNRSRIPIE